MKPQREGGGNNIYNGAVAVALGGPVAADGSAGGGTGGSSGAGVVPGPLGPDELAAYILMQRIFPTTAPAIFVRGGKHAVADAISELGVYTTYLSDGSSSGPLLAEAAGHLLRTKVEGTDEGGVAAGFAVLDSPLLIDQ